MCTRRINQERKKNENLLFLKQKYSNVVVKKNNNPETRKTKKNALTQMTKVFFDLQVKR